MGINKNKIMKKIALFGGSFNPIAKHHINIANELLNYDIDEVWIMPCYESINKKKKLESSEHRLNMCNIAIINNDSKKIKICNFEIENKLLDSPNEIMIEFLKYYKNDSNKFYFVMGADNANNIHNWIDSEKAFNLLPFIIIPREGYDIKKDIWKKESPHIYINNFNIVLGSSTQFREDFKKDKTSELIDRDVLKYIKENNLYN